MVSVYRYSVFICIELMSKMIAILLSQNMSTFAAPSLAQNNHCSPPPLRCAFPPKRGERLNLMCVSREEEERWALSLPHSLTNQSPCIEVPKFGNFGFLQLIFSL